METFTAMAEPTRREIVELLASQDRDAGTIAGEFSISRPAVSRHLRVLREAGIVESRIAGQRRVYRLRPQAFDELEQWVAKYKGFWSKRLDSLEVHVASNKGERSPR